MDEEDEDEEDEEDDDDDDEDEEEEDEADEVGAEGRCGPELGGVRFANHTNITGLSVTDSLVTWYDLRNRPGPPPPGGSVAARGPRPHERALSSRRRGQQRQSGRPQGRISSPVSSVLAWGSGGIRVGIHWGSQGDPDGF